MSSFSALLYLKHDNGLPQELTILTCLNDEHYYTDHYNSILIAGVQSHESAISGHWFDVIVHAVDGMSLQYFFIQCQFTDVYIYTRLRLDINNIT